MKYSLSLVFFLITLLGIGQDNREMNFPLVREKVVEMPKKDKLWIFILAGQSNMAGRGFVEPMDTLSNTRIIALDRNNEWVYAKEPLHFYEPNLTGLDCGLSFAKELLKYIPDDVTIALIPCAVGGSSISQWNNDEIYREVKLLTNFKERVESVQHEGVFKAILWHQGESDTNSKDIPKYKERIEELFYKFRDVTKNESLPILVGELGAFIEPKEAQERYDSINSIIREGAMLDKNRYVISTKDFMHKGDNLHFNSNSQRELGVRFAKEFYEQILH